jgi:hypothetical protein
MSIAFSHRPARSAPLFGTLLGVGLIEVAGFHLLLFRHHPALSLALAAVGLSGLSWIVADYRALGTLETSVTADRLLLRVGRRAAADLPLAAVASAISPSWRDLPSPPPAGFLNPTKPAPPNVLLTFREPVAVRLLGAFERPVRRLALHVDRPAAFLAAVLQEASDEA